MSRAQQPIRDLDEYIVSNRSGSAKKKHRPSANGADEPACDAPLHDGDWTRKVSRQTIFYDYCNNPQCFGGDVE